MGITNVYEKTEAQMTTKEKLERDKGLVLHLDFSTPYSADNLILDKSGNNNHATVVPSTAPVWIENGMIGKGAYSFDGGDIITSPLNSVAKTLSIWIKYTTKPLLNSVILTYANSHIGLGFYNSGTRLIMCSNSPSKRVCSTETMVDEDWNHVVIIYDENYTPSAFINGVEPRYIETTNYWIEPVSNVLHIGGRSIGDKYNGLIDDVRIYSTALSASEVKELYQTRATVDEGGNLSVMGVNYGGNTVEIATNGVLNAKDFSEVGITDGLVAWYPLDGNAKDYTINRNDGTVNGASVAEGLGQGCYSFDGDTSWIRLPNDFITTLSIREYGLSLSCWINLNALVSDKTAVNIQTSSGYSDSSSGGIKINGSLPQMVAYDDGISYKYTTGTTNLTTGVWYHLVGTYNPTDKYIRLYVDGAEEGTPQLISTYSRLLPNTVNSIGRKYINSYFNGLIQDVRIYNRALTPEEIKILYDLTKNKKTSFTSDGKVFIPGQLKEVY